MASIYDWSTTASNNASADSAMTWAEGQAPSTVNNSARQLCARVAELLGDIGGAIAAGGTANGITVTANSSFTTYANGRLVAFKAAADNTGAVTLNVNSIGAKAIRKLNASGDVALSAGDIKEDGVYVCLYNTSLDGGSGGWQILNAPGVSTSANNTWTGDNTFDNTIISNTGGGAIESALAVTGGNFMNLDWADDLTGQTATMRIGRDTTADEVNVDVMPPNGSSTAALRLSSTGVITFPGGGSASYSNNGVTTGAGSTLFSILRTGTAGDASAPSHSWTSDTDTGMYRKSANVIGFSTGGTERITISSSGIAGAGSGLTSLNASNISSGTLSASRLPSSAWTDSNQPSSISLSGDPAIQGPGNMPTTGYVRLAATNSTPAIGIRGTSSTSDRTAIVFRNNDNNTQGSIIIQGLNGVNYASNSDYRLPWKEGATDLQNSGAFIDALKPKYFPKVGQAGFFAHEFAEVSPTSVNGEKDAVDEEGKPIYQSMQASTADVIAHLVAEIQSLRRRMAALESL